MVENIEVVAYSTDWPQLFQTEKARIQRVLGDIALQIEHVGSTAVPDLLAKPVVDIDVIVANPALEESYVPALNQLGYILTIREPSWYQHRMLRLATPRVNLHIFSANCPEHIRHLLFRNWLREHEQDRWDYASAKLAARQQVNTVQAYNLNKQQAVRAIYHKIFSSL